MKYEILTVSREGSKTFQGTLNIVVEKIEFVREDD
jgi:hypothetical protein